MDEINVSSAVDQKIEVHGALVLGKNQLKQALAKAKSLWGGEVHRFRKDEIDADRTEIKEIRAILKEIEVVYKKFERITNGVVETPEKEEKTNE